MRLTEDEQAMSRGAAGPARQWAIQHQVRVGRYLGAADFVPVSQAHIMADTEVLDAAKGGVATAWMLHEMAARGVMPAALVLNRVNPIMVQGAALADFTTMSGFDVDITAVVPDGALVEVDPDGGCVRILTRV
jgi:predicted aconitase with swiveling domain